MKPPTESFPAPSTDLASERGSRDSNPDNVPGKDLETHLVGCWLAPDGSHTDDLFAFDLIGSRLAVHLPSGATLLFDAVDVRKTMDGLLSRRLAEHFAA